MRRIFMVLALAATMLLASASVVLAETNDNARCAGTAGATTNHGGHITGDYVHPNGGGPADSAGGGAPAHFGDNGHTPGASFCQGDGNNAPSLLGDPGRFA
jgi:hypothetical protein